jgi:hypothetical protein
MSLDVIVQMVSSVGAIDLNPQMAVSLELFFQLILPAAFN